MNDRSITRRTFLHRVGGVAVGLSLVPLAGCEENIVTPRMAGREVAFLSPPDLDPAEGGFYIKNGGEAGVPGWSMPDLDPAAWTLRIDGLVATPLTLTLTDLDAEAANAVTLLKTMRCIEDDNTVPGLVGTTLWRGIPLRRFLDRAGLDRDRARRLRIYASDGFTNNLRLDDVYGDFGPGHYEPMLVTHMNGMPLTRAHGRPARLFVYDAYGYKNIKWIERIEATDSDEVFGTYQQVLGYVDDGAIRIASKITNPLFNETLPAGTMLVSGFAVSGYGPITKVELSFDGGPFQETRIVPFDELLAQEPRLAQAQQALDALAFPFHSVWVTWTFRWDATPGTHQIRVRATDSVGNVQQDEDADWDDGSNPIPAVTVVVM